MTDNKTRYADNNFTLLRLLAALFVIISHSFGILQKPLEQPLLAYNGKTIILSDIGLYIFFTISGYLVTQSLFNSDTLTHYLWKRFLRVFPALIVANLVCIIIGCIVTDLSLSRYLLNPDTWTYFFKNSTLVVNQFYLPRVFSGLKDKTVNASIWTIFVEVECYLVLLLGSYSIVSRKWLYLAFFMVFEALRIYMTVFNSFHIKGLDLHADFTFGTYFYLGSLFFVFKDDIRFKWFYANILMALAFATVYTFLEAVTLSVFFAYCFIIIGTSKAVIHLKGNDISYGIYLYAFPVQQLIVLSFGYEINVWLHIILSTIVASIIAFFSWILVEKPFLKNKNSVLFIGKNVR